MTVHVTFRNVWKRVNGKLERENIRVEIEFDAEKAATDMAQKAYDNKSRVAKDCRGAVSVRFTGVPK